MTTSASKATKPALAKKRGAYNFSATATAAAPAAARTSSKKSKSRKAKSGAASPKGTRLDLGLASISSTAANANRQTAETVRDSVNRGSKAFSGAIANAASNAKQMQEKVSNLHREVSQNMAQSASKAARNANRSIEIQRASAEAAAQSYSTASKAAKKTSEQFFSYVNDIFAQNVEAARAALECRNVAELFKLQSATAKQNSAFQQALRISELAIQSATQAMEPINESVAKSSKKFAEFAN